MEIDFQGITRFNARAVSEKLQQSIEWANAWIREIESRIVRLQESLTQTLDDAASISFTTEGNPFYHAVQTAQEIMYILQVQSEVLHKIMQGLLTQRTALLGIIDQTKDVEVETRNLEIKKEMYEKTVEQLREELKANREDARNREGRLLDRFTELTTAVAGLKNVIPSLFPEAMGDPATGLSPSMAIPEQRDADGLTDRDHQNMRGLPKNRQVVYLGEQYPNWPNAKIAQLLDCDTSYVGKYRK